MNDHPSRTTIRAALTRNGHTPSKKIATRVKGLPLTSRGFILEQLDLGQPFQVTYSGGAQRLNDADLKQHLDRLRDTLVAEGFLVERSTKSIKVIGKKPTR